MWSNAIDSCQTTSTTTRTTRAGSQSSARRPTRRDSAPRGTGSDRDRLASSYVGDRAVEVGAEVQRLPHLR